MHPTLRSCTRNVLGVQLYKINACALLSCILSIVNSDWLQHARSVPRVYEIVLGIDHSHIVSIRPGWAHSQRRVGENITIPPPLTVMWMNFDSPNFPSLCSLSAIILFQTCSNKCILYVLLFHKCIKIKYKMVNMYGVFLWLVQSSSRWNTIHSHRNYHVQLLSVRVGEFCHPARSR